MIGSLPCELPPALLISRFRQLQDRLAGEVVRWSDGEMVRWSDGEMTAGVWRDLLLTTSPLTTSPNTYPLAGFHPEDMRRDAGAYSATRGPLVAAQGDPRGPPRRALRGSPGTSRSRGLPFGTRVRRFVSWAILWLPAPLHRWSLAV